MGDGIEVEVRSCCAFNEVGTKWGNDEEYVRLCGKLLCLEDVESGQQRFLATQGHGVSCIAVNQEKHLLAYADKGLHSRIYIHSTEDLELLTVLSEGPELQYTALAFSRNGERLAACADEPDLKVNLWDWKQKILLASGDLPGQIRQASFAHHSQDVFSTLGGGNLYIWYMEKLWDHCRIARAQVTTSNVTCAGWGAMGLYCGCRNGSVELVDNSLATDLSNKHTMEVSNQLPPSSDLVTAVGLHESQLVTGHESGTARAFSLEDDKKMVWEYPIGVTPIRSLEFGGPTLESLLIATDSSSHILQKISTGATSPPRTLSEGHNGPITGCCDTHINFRVCTCGLDGTLRLWDSSTGKQVAKLEGCGLSKVLASSASSNLIALGSNAGVVRLVSLAQLPRMEVVFRVRLHESPISCLAFNSMGTRLASTGLDKRVCFLDCSGTKMSLLGFTEVKEVVLGLSWGQVAQKDLLIMSIASGSLCGLHVPNEAATKETEYKYPNQVTSESLKVEFPLLKLAPASTDSKTAVFALGADRNIRRYELPREQSGWTSGKGRIHRSTTKVEWHGKAVGDLAVNPASRKAASASVDGSLAVWKQDMSGGKKLVTHDLWNGGVSCISFDKSGANFASASLDGSLFFYDIVDEDDTAGGETPQDDQQVCHREYVACGECCKEDTDEEDLCSRNAIGEEVSNDESYREEDLNEDLIHQKFKTLKQSFDRCVLSNSRAPESEKLGPFDFVMDRQLEKQLKAEGDKRVLKIKEAAKKEIQTLQIIWERIKNHCWDPMGVKGATLKGLKSSLEVQNFPLPEGSDAESVLSKIKLLRQVEILEQKSLGIQSQGALLRTNEQEDGKTCAANDDGEAVDLPTEEQNDMEALENLMYDDFDVIVPRRKLMQIEFLKKKIFDAKVAFNEEYQQSMSRKISDMDKIEEINSRIKEVTRDLVNLGGADTVFAPFTPSGADLEDPKTLLTVKDEDVKVEKYLSPEEQAQADEERLQEELRLQSAQKANIFERALDQMMGGTLDKRVEVEDEFKLEMPEWMLEDPSTFDEEQVKEVKEFQLKLKAIEEEKAKKRTALESELRTLSANIEDTCEKFDKHLNQVHHQYLATLSAILQMELQTVCIGHSVHAFLSVSDEREAELMKNLTSIKERRGHLSQSLQDFQAKVAEQQERVHSLSAEDRQMDRTFKKEFSETHENYAQLHELFKWRGDRPNQPVDSTDDPVEKDIPRLQRSMCPEGLQPAWWDKFVEFRDAKIRHEQLLQSGQRSLNLMKKQLQRFFGDDESAENRVIQMVAEINNFKEQRQLITYDIEFPISLKQGQVEMQSEGLSCKFDGGALIHRSQVEELNSVIKSKGSRKVAILTAIKDFKKGIYRLQWENQGCDMKAEDLIERTRELQLLRVNKSVHQVVKQGEASLNSQKSSGYEQLIKFNEKLHKNKIAERQKKLGKLESMIMEKAMQNEQMKSEIERVATVHEDHRRIQHSLSSTQSPSKRVMRNIMTDKKLRDIERSQLAELEILQQELERWHMKTYPSFVDQKQSVGVDQKLPN